MPANNSALANEHSRGDRRSRSIRCPKCRHLNAMARNGCERCGSHLFVSCRDCGERNERGQFRCTSCGRRLHKPLLQKILTRRLGKSIKTTPLQMVFLLVAVFLGYKIIIFFSESLSQSGGGAGVMESVPGA
jgi:hypothetical protein